jgi:hypothetical protein
MALPADTLAALKTLPVDDEGMVRLGDVARGFFHEQAQYAAGYFEGIHGRPVLTEGLRVRQDLNNYHANKLHQDDVAVFVERVLAHKKSLGR